MNYETGTVGLLVLAGVMFILAFALLIYAVWLCFRLWRELSRIQHRCQRMRDLNGRLYRERV